MSRALATKLLAPLIPAVEALDQPASGRPLGESRVEELLHLGAGGARIGGFLLLQVGAPRLDAVVRYPLLVTYEVVVSLGEPLGIVQLQIVREHPLRGRAVVARVVGGL